MPEYAQPEQPLPVIQRSNSRLLLFSALSLILVATGISMALHYPVTPAGVTSVFLVACVAFFVWPNAWLVVLPVLVPVLGFAPWTGWITFEEADLLVIAAAAGGCASWGWRPDLIRAHHPGHGGKSTLAWLLAALFAASTFAAMLRGFADAGGFGFGWLQGYLEPMNSARLAKSFFSALLLALLWRMANQRSPEHAQALLGQGLMLAFGATALTALWERLAFPGLLDFSSDYRTTGMFWEMHVGGAALDGFLAMTLPFAIFALVQARTPLRWSVAGATIALGAYACLTTFSRGVYLAAAVSVVVFSVLHLWQQRQKARETANSLPESAVRRQWLAALMIVIGFAAGAAWMFATSGYRGMAALLAAAAFMLPLAAILRTFDVSQWLVGVVMGAVLAGLAVAITWLVPKGAYVAWSLAAGLTLSMLAILRRSPQSGGKLPRAMAFGSFIATVSGTALVANNWGDAPGLQHAAPVLLILLAVTVIAGLSPRSLWPDTLRWQATTAGCMGLVAAVIGVFGGGAYIGDRFATGERDLAGRFAHWQLGRDMLLTPTEWMLGKGLGRFTANFALIGDPQAHPGDYRIRHESGNSYLTLTGGLHTLGSGEMFRVTQRVSEPTPPLSVFAVVRTSKDIALSFELCEKHLLYSQGCLKRTISVTAASGKWQTVDAPLQGDAVSRGSWYAPRLLAFSMAVETPGGMADIDQLKLVEQGGRDLLTNGDFSRDMAHWFFTSDKHHLPWHMKNVFLHVLFEQGFAGLTLWTLLLSGALLRLCIGNARSHVLAPVLAASLAGFITVGLFDSLLDVPRDATLFYFLVLLGITIRVTRQSDRGGQPTRKEGVIHTADQVPRPASRVGLIRRFSMALLLIVIAAPMILGVAGWMAIPEGRSLDELTRLTPAESIRHIKSSLTEHDLLGTALLPPLQLLQSAIERSPPSEQLGSLGKGQQPHALPTQQYSAAGDPLPVGTGSFAATATAQAITVSSVNQLTQAIEQAIPGRVIEIEPGSYRLNRPIGTQRGGTAATPITVSSAKPGAVLIEFNTVEGFLVTHPYWVFENLTIRGVCPKDHDCEHAFHVVGAARGVVLRNNRIENFNAHIKVNGENGRWPDNGLVQFNTLTNQHPRDTARSVAPFDLVAASGWLVADNLVTNFVSQGGNQISYGMYMKGGGAHGRIERNLIICTSRDISAPGNRIGLSWGGGLSDNSFCRDKTCAAEHSSGLAANNVVAHCNDVGIDVNHGRLITLAHNTLINTAGILIRGQSSEINVHANLLDGRIQSRDGIALTHKLNDVTNLRKVFLDPDALTLARKPLTSADTPYTSQVPTDFCHQPRRPTTWKGATGDVAPPCVALGK